MWFWQPQGLICVSIKNSPSSQHLIQRREVNTTFESKHTNVLANEEVLKTDNMKNVCDNAKEETLTLKHSYTQKPYE